VGRAIELRKTQNQGADSLLIGGRQHGCLAINASEQTVLRSRRTRALKNNMHENRETSGAPRPEGERGRSAKAQSHAADTYVLEESDLAIISMSQTNKEERSSAEPGEKRARAKENIVQPHTRPTQSERPAFLEHSASSLSQIGASGILLSLVLH
jgi:hypothetical protein